MWEVEEDKKFYNSRAWRRLRLKILKRDKGECQKCKAVGKYSRAIIVHHIQELKNRPDLSMQESNLQSLCNKCHEEHHERFRYIFNPNKFRNEERF